AAKSLAIVALISLAGGRAAWSQGSRDLAGPERTRATSIELRLAAADVTPAAAADSQGIISVPQDYRATYRYLGSWAVARPDGKGAEQIHAVYASPGTVEGFLKEGHFPAGAVLVKEVFDAATADMTTGTVSRENILKGWFVMVRDAGNTHPGNKLWGD